MSVTGKCILHLGPGGFCRSQGIEPFRGMAQEFSQGREKIRCSRSLEVAFQRSFDFTVGKPVKADMPGAQQFRSLLLMRVLGFQNFQSLHDR